MFINQSVDEQQWQHPNNFRKESDFKVMGDHLNFLIFDHNSSIIIDIFQI